MKRKHRMHLATAIIVLGCLAAPAWAALERQHLFVDFQPVRSDGTLEPLTGLPVEFFALLNTTTGKFIGTARAGIVNESFANQIYIDPGLQLGAPGVTLTVIHDLYFVRADGDATYLVLGKEN